MSDAGRRRQRPAVRPVRGRGEVPRDAVKPFRPVQLLQWHRARRPLGGLPVPLRQLVQRRGPRTVWGGPGAREPAALAPCGRLFPHVAQHRDFLGAQRSTTGSVPRTPLGLAEPRGAGVPTPSALAYVAAHWLPRGRAESAETEHTRGLVHAIVLSE